MADFQTVDLGRILQTAESIKGMRQNTENDKLRNAYLGHQQQRQDQQDQQAQADAQQKATTDAQNLDWKRVASAAASVAASQTPKEFAEQNFPQFIQEWDSTHGAGSWNTLDDNKVRQLAQGYVAHAQSQLGEMPAQPAAETFGQPQDFNQDGKPIVAQVGNRGTVRPIKGATPITKPPPAGESYDPQSVENTAQMIAGNQIPMISGFALKSKWGQEVISRVREINPQFAGADYNANLSGIKNFTSGKNGNTVRSLNVAVQHLDQLGKLATALNNGDTPALNSVAQWWKKNTGQAAPTNFEAAKKIVADEIVKAVVGSGGGVSDREEAAKAISAAGSPQQLAQVIDTYQGLMTGQLNGLREQYKASTGRDNFEDMLLPETRSRLERHADQNAPQNVGSMPLTNSKGWQLHQDAQGNKAYVGPNGEVEELR